MEVPCESPFGHQFMGGVYLVNPANVADSLGPHSLYELNSVYRYADC